MLPDRKFHTNFKHKFNSTSLFRPQVIDKKNKKVATALKLKSCILVQQEHTRHLIPKKCASDFSAKEAG